MNKNNIKFIVIFGVILAIYLIIMILIFGIDKDQTSNNNPSIEQPSTNLPGNNNDSGEQNSNEIVDGVFLLDSTGIITKTSNEWKIGKVDNILNKKFNVYNNDDLLGIYTILYNNGFNIYDDNNNKINIEGSLFAVNTEKNFYKYNLDDEEITEEDKDVIKKLLDSKGITYDIDKLLIEKNISDYNKDGLRESLYTISFINGLEDTENYQEFSIAFINYQKGNLIIYSNLNESLCAVDLKQYFDYDASKYVLFTCNYPSEQGFDILLYKLNGELSFEELKAKIEE